MSFSISPAKERLRKKIIPSGCSLQSGVSLSLWFKVAFVLDADVYVTFNVLQQKLKSFQTKGKLKVYKKC